LSTRCGACDDLAEAIARSRRALELGERTGQEDVVAHSLNCLGYALLDLGDPGGAAHLRRSATRWSGPAWSGPGRLARPCSVCTPPHAAVLAKEFSDTIRFTSAPRLGQRALFGLLAPGARATGQRTRST
jgi:hypothetical protein